MRKKLGKNEKNKLNKNIVIIAILMIFCSILITTVTVDN